MNRDKIDEAIGTEFVNIITENGLQKVLLTQAVEQARETDENVVCLNDNCEIPVVKIISYKKYIYDKQKKDKDNQRKQRLSAQDIKQVQFSPDIAEHDMEIKANSIDKMLQHGDKVILNLKYRGRMMTRISTGKEFIKTIASHIHVSYKCTSEPKINGNTVSMTIIADK